MKKLPLLLILIALVQLSLAQRNCPTTVTQAWYVLNGQTVKNVYPPREGISMYTINITGTGLENLKLIQTEEIEGLTQSETVNGVFRWAIRFKINKSRSISTIVFLNKCNCSAGVFKLITPVFLWNAVTDNGGLDN